MRNYIKLLSKFYLRAVQDPNLKPTHISLFNALFQLWNQVEFLKPVIINRKVLMRYSKIGSNHTLYKCLQDLDRWEYIRYLPSHDSNRNSQADLSLIHNYKVQLKKKSKRADLCKNDISTCAESNPDLCKSDISTCAESNPDLCKSDIGACAKMHSNINSIYTKDIYTNSILYKEKNQNKFSSDIKSEFFAPELNEVVRYFSCQDQEQTQAEKFYNYYASKGWKIGERALMTDWQAAARNWIINYNERQALQNKSEGEHFNKKKNYEEPL